MKGRVPVFAWVILGVAALHAGAFWLLADKHFLPKVRRMAPAPPANFAAGKPRVAIDPATGERTVVSEYVVSTQLRPPPGSPAASPPPK